MDEIKTSVTNSPEESEVKGKAVKKSGKRIGYNYIILRSLKESQKNDVATCLYIKSFTNFGFCVIKEGTYGDSKDKHGRDIKDRLMWQKQLHESLQGKVRLPRLLGSFEENGNYYLVLERIRGKSLHKVCREAGNDLRVGLITGNKLGMKFLDYMLQMISLLETLHQHGIVHRDVTATNFMITPAGKVAVIDMELSYSLEKHFPEPPFQLGTYGYMSPEQEKTEMPAYDQDVFSVGAILLQMWTGISPSKLTNSSFDQLTEKVRFLVPDHKFAEEILRCLHPEPGMRPKLNELIKMIASYCYDLKQKIWRSGSVVKKYAREEILQTVQSAIGALSSPLLADEEKGWFSENINTPVTADKKKMNKSWYTSFQKGACGPIYVLSKANMLGLSVESTRPFIQKGIDLIDQKYIKRIQDTNPSLYMGSSGIAVVLATMIREGLVEPQTEYFDWIRCLLDKSNSEMNFQNGISGQGLATMLCNPFLHPGREKELLKDYADRLIGAQQKDGSWLRSIKDKKNRVTRGFSQGVAGIVYFLLEYANYCKSDEAIRSSQKGLQWLMKKAVIQKESIQWRSSSGKDIAPWWCEGAAGIALTFIRAHSLLGDPNYKRYAVGALLNHPKQVMDNNLSQCHGLSGLAEIYLEAFSVFQDEEWINRASWVIQLLMQIKKEHTNHGTYWVVESERQPVSDFMTGNSGIIHCLLRFCYPDKLRFPLIGVESALTQIQKKMKVMVM